MESPKGELGGWFKTLWIDKSLLILEGNINKNYRLPFKRLYRRGISENHEYRKISSVFQISCGSKG